MSDLEHSMQDALGGAVKGSCSPSSRSNPIDGLLAMPVLVQLWDTAIIV